MKNVLKLQTKGTFKKEKITDEHFDVARTRKVECGSDEEMRWLVLHPSLDNRKSVYGVRQTFQWFPGEMQIKNFRHPPYVPNLVSKGQGLALKLRLESSYVREKRRWQERKNDYKGCFPIRLGKSKDWKLTWINTRKVFF